MIEQEDAMNSLAKLRAAIAKIGFSVMQTSGEWSIHGVREYDKKMEEDDLKRVNRIIELEVELEKCQQELEGWRTAEKHWSLGSGILAEFDDAFREDPPNA